MSRSKQKTKTGGEPPPPEGSEASLVVGIGASAGGLAAYKSFLQNMPSASGMSFVLVQHLDPDHASMLVELLAPHTAMPIAQARDGEEVAPNHVYIIPPNATLTIKDGVLRVVTPAPAREHRRPIDTFFRSLAMDQRERAASIVLSGVGSDGTAGLRDIKANGGLTLAQAEFDETAMPGMPTSAAATGLVDHVVAIKDMPQKLIDHQRDVRAGGRWRAAQGGPEAWTERLAAISEALRGVVGHDFSNYKENTMIRRVQRRMLALEIDDAAAYVERLRADPGEADLLFRELLIGVTRFFRDPEAFDALNAEVVPALIEGRGPDDPIRVWVPGCATGEEVYTLAILLKEALAAARSGARAQIFGTDLDANAIAVARAARYRKPVEGVSAERLKKWFSEEGGACCPVKSIREMCVFSSHSLIKDPPFSKLDLVSCRNVLIYLNSNLQQEVVHIFHYALKPGGVLLLGPSEGISRDAGLFDVVDKKHRILRRRETGGGSFLGLRSMGASSPLPPPPSRPVLSDDSIEKSARRVIEPYSPVYFVIDHKHDVVRFSGGETGQYVEPMAGPASLNLFSLLRRVLRPAVRAAVMAAQNDRRGVTEEIDALGPDGRNRALSLIVEPIEGGMFVVALRELARSDGGARPAAAGEGKRAPAADEDLRATKAQLKAAVNELETYQEEVKSATEEMQSVNEELQSSNEELETSKEEMQSINEELQTVNAELHNKNAALTRLNDDLQNLFESTQIATLFLDGDLRIRNFTPAMTALFHVRPADIGRPIVEIVSKLHYEDLASDAEEVQRSLGGIEREVEPRGGGAAFLLRIRPYRTRDNRLDGVVVTFVDITERKRAEGAMSHLSAIVTSSSDAVISEDLLGVIKSWNTGAQSLFGYTAEEAIGQSAALLIPSIGDGDEPAVLARIERGEGVNRYDAVRRRKDGPLIDVSFTVSPFRDASGRVVGSAKIARDITQRKRAEEVLRESEERYRTLFNSIDEGFCVIEMIFDANDRPVDYRFLQVSPSFEKQTGIKDAVGKTMREIAPGHEEHWFEIYGKIALTGEPARFQNRAEQLRRWYDVYAFRFGAAEKRQVATLFNDITVRLDREEHLKLVMHELSHRAKNLLLLIQTMASQTARTSPSIEDFLQSFNARIQALARSHDLLTDTNWAGAPLEKVVDRHLQPFAGEDSGRLEARGPPIVVSSRAAQAIGLALHELATNASKYGALSNSDGKVAVGWSLDGEDGARRFRLTWRERGGPPVAAPRRGGFGRVLIERLTASQFNGDVSLEFPSEGVIWSLEAPEGEVLQAGGQIDGR